MKKVDIMTKKAISLSIILSIVLQLFVYTFAVENKKIQIKDGENVVLESNGPLEKVNYLKLKNRELKKFKIVGVNEDLSKLDYKLEEKEGSLDFSVDLSKAEISAQILDSEVSGVIFSLQNRETKKVYILGMTFKKEVDTPIVEPKGELVFNITDLGVTRTGNGDYLMGGLQAYVRTSEGLRKDLGDTVRIYLLKKGTQNIEANRIYFYVAKSNTPRHGYYFDKRIEGMDIGEYAIYIVGKNNGNTYTGKLNIPEKYQKEHTKQDMTYIFTVISGNLVKISKKNINLDLSKPVEVGAKYTEFALNKYDHGAYIQTFAEIKETQGSIVRELKNTPKVYMLKQGVIDNESNRKYFYVSKEKQSYRYYMDINLGNVGFDQGNYDIYIEMINSKGEVVKRKMVFANFLKKEYDNPKVKYFKINVPQDGIIEVVEKQKYVEQDSIIEAKLDSMEFNSYDHGNFIQAGLVISEEHEGIIKRVKEKPRLFMQKEGDNLQANKKEFYVAEDFAKGKYSYYVDINLGKGNIDKGRYEIYAEVKDLNGKTQKINVGYHNNLKKNYTHKDILGYMLQVKENGKLDVIKLKEPIVEIVAQMKEFDLNKYPHSNYIQGMIQILEKEVEEEAGIVKSEKELKTQNIFKIELQKENGQYIKDIYIGEDRLGRKGYKYFDINLGKGKFEEGRYKLVLKGRNKLGNNFEKEINIERTLLKEYLKDEIKNYKILNKEPGIIEIVSRAEKKNIEIAAQIKEFDLNKYPHSNYIQGMIQILEKEVIEKTGVVDSEKEIQLTNISKIELQKENGQYVKDIYIGEDRLGRKGYKYFDINLGKEEFPEGRYILVLKARNSKGVEISKKIDIDISLQKQYTKKEIKEYKIYLQRIQEIDGQVNYGVLEFMSAFPKINQNTIFEAQISKLELNRYPHGAFIQGTLLLDLVGDSGEKIGYERNIKPYMIKRGVEDVEQNREYMYVSKEEPGRYYIDKYLGHATYMQTGEYEIYIELTQGEVIKKVRVDIASPYIKKYIIEDEGIRITTLKKSANEAIIKLEIEKTEMHAEFKKIEVNGYRHGTYIQGKVDIYEANNLEIPDNKNPVAYMVEKGKRATEENRKYLYVAKEQTPQKIEYYVDINLTAQNVDGIYEIFIEAIDSKNQKNIFKLENLEAVQKRIEKDGYIVHVEKDQIHFTNLRYFVEGKYGESYLKTKGDHRGTDLKYYKMGKGANTLFTTFALHGFEDLWAHDGLELQYIGEKFKEYFANNVEILDILNNWTIYIFPLVNPDGAMYGYTNNGIGRTTFGCPHCQKGIDLNRNFKVPGMQHTERKSNRNYNGKEGFEAIEAKSLADFILQNQSQSGKNILVDVHGWLNQTIGDRTIGDYYKQEYGMNKHIDSYGDGYLIHWAKKALKNSRSLLLELPDNVRNHQDVVNNKFAEKFINGTIKMLRALI